MAVIKYLSDLDLNNNKLIDAALNGRSSHPSNPVGGYIYYNNADGNVYCYVNGNWEILNFSTVISKNNAEDNSSTTKGLITGERLWQFLQSNLFNQSNAGEIDQVYPDDQAITPRAVKNLMKTIRLPEGYDIDQIKQPGNYFIVRPDKSPPDNLPDDKADWMIHTWGYIGTEPDSTAGDMWMFMGNATYPDLYYRTADKTDSNGDPEWSDWMLVPTMDSVMSAIDSHKCVDNVYFEKKKITDRPSTFKRGITLDGNTPVGNGWTDTLSTILTFKENNARIFQMEISKETSKVRWRSASGSNSWAPWKTPGEGGPTGDFIPKSAISHSTTSNSATNVASSRAIKTVTDQFSKSGTASNSIVQRDGTKINAAGGFFETSDVRLKTNIKNLDISLEDILNIPVVSYTKDKQESIGTIAQNIDIILPEIVSKSKSGILSIDYTKLSVVALKGIKLLNNKIEDLDKRISKLENNIK